MDICIFCSSARGSFLLLSVMGHAGGPDEHWVQVWALAKVRGTCSEGSKSRNVVNNHGIAFRPARANQAHENPKNKAQFAPHVIFSFFVLGCCCYGTTAALQDFFFMTATNDASACGLVSMRACARGVNSCYPQTSTHTWLTVASSGTYTAAHAV